MNKIKVHFNGGLGNQLFQYAACRNILKSNPKLKTFFFVKNLNWSKGSVNIDYYLNLKIVDTGSSFFLKIIDHFIDPLFGHVLQDNSLDQIDYKNVPKKNFYILRGFFQNFSWYKTVINEICNDILLQSKEKVFDKFDNSELVVALRRSDYIKLGWEIKLKYYYDALKILNKDKNKKITIVSEDIQFNNLLNEKFRSHGYKVLPMRINSKFPKSVNDFVTIIKSENLIMANSSFSWWGAAIRSEMKFDNKKVIIPKNWFPNNQYFHPGNPFKWNEVDNSFVYVDY